MRKMLTIKQVRERLHMSDTKLREIIKKDPTFPAYLIEGRYKIDEADLDQWIEQRKVVPTHRLISSSKRGRPKKQFPKVKIVYEVNTPGWNVGQG